MNTHLPLVSVVIPAYNAEAFIEQTLNSVLQQTYQNIEVLVVDDGSSDRTAEMVRTIEQSDSRIILLHQPNAGVAVARNLGLHHARGEFVAPLDADDLWHKENLEKQIECFLNSDVSVGLVYSWSFDIDERSQPLKGFSAARIQGMVDRTLLCHNFIGNASATLIRRDCLATLGGYDCTLKTQNAEGCEDLDLYLRIAERYQFRVVPHFLVGYRKLVNSMSCDYRKMAKSHDLVISRFRSRHPDIPAILFSLACSSLYIYFAKQSHRGEQYKIALFWLKQALKTDWLVLALRLDFYQLGIRAILGLVLQRLGANYLPQLSASTQETTISSAYQSPCWQPLSHQFQQQVLYLPDEKSRAVLLKIWAANVIYWLTSRSALLNIFAQ